MVTIHRHAAYNKWLVTIEKNSTTTEIILYDLTVSELSEFIKNFMGE